MSPTFSRRRRYPAPAEADETYYAADFELTNSEYLSVADNAAISMGDIDFSISLWVNPESQTAVYYPLNKGGGNVDYEISIDTAGGFLFEFWNGVYKSVPGANGNAPLATWTHLVCWHDAAGNTLNMRVNDTTNYSAGTGGVAPLDSATGLFIGQRGNSSGYYDGLIARVGLWKKVISAGEITALYSGGPQMVYADLSATLKTNLVAWWALDEEGGVRSDDAGSSHLTDNNTVGWAEIVYP